MKKMALIFILLAGVIGPWACTNSQPTGPLAIYNLTATFTNTFTFTPTNWAGFTSTPTPGTGTGTATPFSPPAIPTATPASTFVNTGSPSQPTPVLTSTPWTTINEQSTPSAPIPPNGLAYDSAATIYVAEGGEGSPYGQIQMFNAGGTLQGTMTTYNGVTPFGQPNGVAYYGGNIYVVDQVNNAVYEINPQNNSLVNSPLTSFSSLGVGSPTSFLNPEGIAVDTSGNVYVADTGNDYIEKFSSTLSTTPLAEVGGLGSGNSQFNNPSAVDVDGSGNVYVVDASNQRVQIFNSGFAYSSQFWTAVSNSSDVYGITLDNSNNIYLADSGTGQIEVYSSAGAFITSGLGGGPSGSDPVGLAFVGTNNLWVADYSNQQLYVVTP
jgi:hypothetical protein